MQVHGAAAKSAEIRSQERQVGGAAVVNVHECAGGSVMPLPAVVAWVQFGVLMHFRLQAAVERTRRRESIELAAMQAYEEKLQKQEEERRRKSAGGGVQRVFFFLVS
jgi:hypothetical protein